MNQQETGAQRFSHFLVRERIRQTSESAIAHARAQIAAFHNRPADTFWIGLAHQWMSEQYGLKRLIEHIWKVIGIASTCEDIRELKAKMEELYGKSPGFQFQFKLLPGAPA